MAKKSATKASKASKAADPTPPPPPTEPLEVVAPILFEHGLPKAEVFRPLRYLRDALEAAGRPELEHANALLAILEPA